MKTINELSEYNCTAYWWNIVGRRKLDFSGNLSDLLTNKGIKVKKVKDNTYPNSDCYVFTTPHRVTYRHLGSALDGAITAVKLWYATMGDKATVNISGRTFTINH